MFRGYCRLKLPPDKNFPKNSIKQLKKSFCSNLDKNEKIPEKPGKLSLNQSENNETIIDINDESLVMLKKAKRITDLHLFDEKIAKTISSLIIHDLKEQRGFIAEINPGCGLITKELLKSGIPKIHGFEKISGFGKYLSPLMNEYPGKLEIRYYNLLKLGKLQFIDNKTNNDNLKRIFEGLERREFEDEPGLIIIGAVPVIKFFSSLQWSIICYYLQEFGRAVIYAAVLPSISMAFLDNPEVKYFQKPMIIFLRTFFNCKKLGTVPRNGFFPLEQEKNSRKRNAQFFINDKEFMDIMKFEVNKNFINDEFSRYDASVFFCFLSIHLKRRNTRIIPALEKWIPGCGPRLIRENYNIYTIFDELNSQQLLELFKMFKSWPEYETSSFVDFVDTIMHNERTED